ncbi:toll/interleukin-1 receptor domain-containing protein [Myroides odoratimimus]|uniref:toll/interleukin-1 receptor domain-containing protein n=1 Tax=Myroides odoratimimus TaxID=76832 RepID=UPI003D2F8C96
MSKKVFISYSWGTSEHQKWVRELAERLMNNTVDVVLDKWDLKPGHDIYSFMEEMVKSDDIDKVLIICDKNYSNKADSRSGGVGTETQIITPNVYSSERQEKFLPIVIERGDDGTAYLPTYLRSRMYIDFSNEDDYENSYEELLRNILDAPAIPKPKLGTNVPAYINESNTNFSELRIHFNTLENQLKKNNLVNRQYLDDFLECFKNKLKDYGVKTQGYTVISEWANVLLDTLRAYSEEIKELYIDFLVLITKNNVADIDEVLIDFFSDVPLYKSKLNNQTSGDIEFYNIVFHELFIMTIALFVKYNRYDLVGEMLQSKYYIKERYAVETVSFEFIYKHNRYFEDYASNTLGKTTGMGYYLINSKFKHITQEELILGDIICYTVSSLLEDRNGYVWFPVTYLYSESRNIVFFEKFSSAKFFDKIKVIFGLETVEQLKRKLFDLQSSTEESKRLRYSTYMDYVPFVFELIKIDKIGEYK